MYMEENHMINWLAFFVAQFVSQVHKQWEDWTIVVANTIYSKEKMKGKF